MHCCSRCACRCAVARRLTDVPPLDDLGRRALRPGPRETRGDHDVETPTGAPVVTWIGVSAQRAAVAAALAHHTSATAIGLDAFSLIPGVKLARGAASAGARRFLEHLPEAVHAARTGSGAVELMAGDGGDVPAGMRAGRRRHPVARASRPLA